MSVGWSRSFSAISCKPSVAWSNVTTPADQGKSAYSDGHQCAAVDARICAWLTEPMMAAVARYAATTLQNRLRPVASLLANRRSSRTVRCCCWSGEAGRPERGCCEMSIPRHNGGHESPHREASARRTEGPCPVPSGGGGFVLLRDGDGLAERISGVRRTSSPFRTDVCRPRRVRCV